MIILILKLYYFLLKIKKRNLLFIKFIIFFN